MSRGSLRVKHIECSLEAILVSRIPADRISQFVSQVYIHYVEKVNSDDRARSPTFTQDVMLSELNTEINLQLKKLVSEDLYVSMLTPEQPSTDAADFLDIDEEFVICVKTDVPVLSTRVH